MNSLLRGGRAKPAARNASCAPAPLADRRRLCTCSRRIVAWSGNRTTAPHSFGQHLSNELQILGRETLAAMVLKCCPPIIQTLESGWVEAPRLTRAGIEPFAVRPQ